VISPTNVTKLNPQMKNSVVILLDQLSEIYKMIAAFRTSPHIFSVMQMIHNCSPRISDRVRLKLLIFILTVRSIHVHRTQKLCFDFCFLFGAISILISERHHIKQWDGLIQSTSSRVAIINRLKWSWQKTLNMEDPQSKGKNKEMGSHITLIIFPGLHFS
jgi:hypothetical protein